MAEEVESVEVPEEVPEEEMAPAPDPAQFLRDHHPEVFRIKPKRGTTPGSQLLPVSDEKGVKNEFENLCKILGGGGGNSRRYRIHRVLEESVYATGNYEENLQDRGARMIGAVVTCIILMAAGWQGLPRDLIDFTLQFLDGVTDDSGLHPPNIQGMINHIENGPELGEAEITVQTVTRVSLT